MGNEEMQFTMSIKKIKNKNIYSYSKNNRKFHRKHHYVRYIRAIFLKHKI